MALFKINRGNENNLPETLTNGWAYFCTNGNFYIDYADSEGELHRKQINADAANKLHFTENDTVVEISAEVINGVVDNAILFKNSPILLDNNFSPYAVCYNDGTVYAIGNHNSYAAYSTDGANWIRCGNSMEYASWTDICYGNGVYVAYNSNQIMYSTDGMNWNYSSYSSGISSYSYIAGCSMTFGNGKFVMIVRGTTMQDGSSVSSCTSVISTDGINWEVGSTLTNGIKYKDICYVTDKYWTIGVSDNWESYIAYSEDGINWTENRMFETEPVQYPENSVIGYGNGRFVTLDISYYAWSDDGINWNSGEIGNINSVLKKIIYGNNVFVATTVLGNQLFYSEDGTNWEFCEIDERATGNNCLWFNGSEFFKIQRFTSSYAQTLHSRDGLNWEVCGEKNLQNSEGTDITEDVRQLLVGDIITAIDNL